MRVGIVGLGLMGASFALALRRALPEVDLVGYDRDPATRRRAQARGLVRAGDPRWSDVLVLAAPIAALPELLAGLAGHRGVVTDMASTKVQVMSWAAAAGVDLVGGHPMCGREQSGLDAADPAIFEAAPWVLTRDEPRLTALVRAVGARPVFMAADKHDRLVAGVSHAAFVISAAYVLAMAGRPDWPDMQKVAGSGFRDVSRLAAGDPALYSAIVGTNRKPIAEAVIAVEDSLARLRRHLESADPRLVELLEEARRARVRWEAEASSRAAAPGGEHAGQG